MRLAFVILLLLLSPMAEAKEALDCSITDAVYKPARDIDRPYSYTLRIEKGEEGNLTTVSYFLWVELWNIKSGQKVSALRLGNNCVGMQGCTLSAEFGQFNSIQYLEDVQSTLHFDIILTDKEFRASSDLSIVNNELPYAIILPHNPIIFKQNQKFQDDYKKYVKSYTDEKIFPDFAGMEIWIFDHCNNSSKY